MPVEGRPTRIHDLVVLVYDNGGGMVLPNYGMNDPTQLDELPNRAVIQDRGFGFDELRELTSLAEQAGLLDAVLDLAEERDVGEDGEVQMRPVTTLYALTPQGTAVARERAEAANTAAFGDRIEDAVERAVERSVEAGGSREPVTVEIDAGEIADEIEWPDPPYADEDEADEVDTEETEEEEEPGPGTGEPAAAPAPRSAPAIDADVVADATRAVTAFAAALVLVASADATRNVLVDVVPVDETAFTAGLLALYTVVLIFVVRTTFKIGRRSGEETAEDADVHEDGDDEDQPDAEEDEGGDEESDGSENAAGADDAADDEE